MTTTLRRITATYVLNSDFYLPPWLKEEDIAEKWVKYDSLHIETKDGKHYVIPPYASATECDDFKYPDNDLDEEDEDIEEEDLDNYILIEPDDYTEE